MLTSIAFSGIVVDCISLMNSVESLTYEGNSVTSGLASRQ